MRYLRYLTIRIIVAALAVFGIAATVPAQATANDPATRLNEVLPADIAAHVLATIARAQAHGLSGDALENRALKFAAKGVAPASIERSVAEQEERMEQVRDTLQRARGRKPADDEIEAGAEAMRKGVHGAAVSALARSAPSGRSLAVPLYVIGSLMDRGLPSDSALARVEARLQLRASDRDLENMPNDIAPQNNGNGNGNGNGRGNRPAETGRDLAETKHPGSANGAGQEGGSGGGPPSGVPANGGKNAKPTIPPGQAKKPDTPKKP
jgi:hypothetical protein